MVVQEKTVVVAVQLQVQVVLVVQVKAHIQIVAVDLQVQAQVKLQEMQASLQKEATEADQKLAKKEGELTKPLYEELDAAIKKVAKENKYTYIFDKKFLLYSESGIDATAKVKTALGICW